MNTIAFPRLNSTDPWFSWGEEAAASEKRLFKIFSLIE